MNRKLFIFSILLFTLFSCKKQIYTFKPFEKRKFNVAEISFDYFTARSKIKYTDGEESFNAVANIRMKNDSIIWISVTPGMGVEILRAVITPDSIYMINRLKKEFFAESIDSVSHWLNINLNYSMLQSVLLGNLVLPRDQSEKVTRSGDYYVLKQQSRYIAVNNFINLKSMKIEKVNITDDSTRNYLNIVYQNFENIDSVLFAMDNSINLFYSDKSKTFNSQVIFNYTKASFTDKKVRFPFNVPNRYDFREN